MKNMMLSCLRWLRHQDAVYDNVIGCLGTIALTILLSQKLWTMWLGVPSNARLLTFVKNAWPYLLLLLGVYCLYAWALRRKLRIQAGRSGWWALPLMLPIIFFPIYGLNSLQARVYLLLTFLVLTPLFFVKWKVKMEEKTRAGAEGFHL